MAEYPFMWPCGVNARCGVLMYRFLSHLLLTTKAAQTMGQPGRALGRLTQGGMVGDMTKLYS